MRGCCKAGGKKRNKPQMCRPGRITLLALKKRNAKQEQYHRKERIRAFHSNGPVPQGRLELVGRSGRGRRQQTRMRKRGRRRRHREPSMKAKKEQRATEEEDLLVKGQAPGVGKKGETQTKKNRATCRWIRGQPSA